MVIIAYDIATFRNRTLKQPAKMYDSGSHFSITSYAIIASKQNHTALGLIEMHGNGLICQQGTISQK